ncbi:MAG: D-cysteine desulfhydrase family protein [Chloroflexi bacterium]|nr:D-cysteine desulfhydrase family protein [Chloroflexota bacterium]
MPTIESLPRYKLASLPTPLDELPRLSRDLGIRVLMKRDDLTGFALGGNKARKLEFLLADALQQGAQMLVTGGGPQSNHVRMTGAAARKAGLGARALLFGKPPDQVNGNLLLDELLGVEYSYAGTDDKLVTDRMLVELNEELRAQNRKPYLIPVGGSTVLGCISYIIAVGELLEQLRAQKAQADYIFITTGSCGTHAGILAGVKYFGASIPVIGISVSRAKSECETRIANLAQQTAKFLNYELPITPADITVYEEYLGAGYALITPAARAAIYRVARLEGIFLDQVYTGKTMAGMIDLIERGAIEKGATVVFWHTGGMPGIFGHPQDFANSG